MHLLIFLFFFLRYRVWSNFWRKYATSNARHRHSSTWDPGRSETQIPQATWVCVCLHILILMSIPHTFQNPHEGSAEALDALGSYFLAFICPFSHWQAGCNISSYDVHREHYSYQYSLRSIVLPFCQLHFIILFPDVHILLVLLMWKSYFLFIVWLLQYICDWVKQKLIVTGTLFFLPCWFSKAAFTQILLICRSGVSAEQECLASHQFWS